MPIRYLYTLLFYLALPLVLLRLLWRARKNPAYAQRWQERFGYLSGRGKKNCIWLHAVSVGESLAAVPIIKALRKKYPNIPIVVTGTTPTGADRIQAALKNDVTQFYLPYDLPDALNRFFDAVQPRLGIIMETELWPNLLNICGKRNIPIFLANARLSERSAKGYGRIAKLTEEMLQHITSMAVQTPVEADRFIALGLPSDRIHVTGSIKFDLEIPADLTARAQTLRSTWGKDRLVWIAASTHQGEENQILEAYSLICKTLPQTLLVLVPRHPDRFAQVATACKRQGFEIVLRSENIPCTPMTQIFIGDSMGELLLFYAASDVAFVGGSLIATGGHNPLEPAALGLPVLMGPHYFNFAAISEQLQKVGAMIKVDTPQELADHVLQLLQNTSSRQQMGVNGQHFVAQNRGALTKHLALIDGLLHNSERTLAAVV